MSESFDKKGVPLPPSRNALGFDPSPTLSMTQADAQIPAGAASFSHGASTGAEYSANDATQTPRTQPPREFAAPIATPQPEVVPNAAPIVPEASITSRSLTLVIAIMCFFACLTAGTVYLMNKSAAGWMRNIASEVTVQIEPSPNGDTEQTVRQVAAWLRNQPGILSADAIPLATSRALLEPWLGSGEALRDLPVPRLVAIQLDRSSPVDFDALSGGLRQRFATATLDDHRQWQTQIQTVTRSFALGGLAILILVGAATTAIIVSATRSAMLSNREIVEVLHFVGATDRFIAHEFEKNFLRLGIRAGLVGAFAAAVVFLAMPTIMSLLGGSSMTLAEIKRFVGPGSLDAMGFLLLGIVVIVVAALCMLTSRFGVYRILNNR